MLNKNFKPVILITLILFTVFGIGSCQKAKDTIGVVVVKDSNGNLISGATVVLHLDSLAENQQGNFYNSNLRKTDITDASGRAEFTYDLKQYFRFLCKRHKEITRLQALVLLDCSKKNSNTS